LSTAGPKRPRCYLFLEELRHEVAAGQQVRLRETPGLHQVEAPQQPAGQRRDAVGNDHRPLDERRLERRGPRCDERRIAGGEHLLGTPVDEFHGHARRMLGERGAEAGSCGRGGHRRDK
jgi:hypothetical protein